MAIEGTVQKCAVTHEAGLAVAKAVRFGLLFVTVMPKFGSWNGIPLAKIQSAAAKAHLACVGTHIITTGARYLDGQQGRAVDGFQEFADVGLTLSDLTIAALLAHRLHPFLEKGSAQFVQQAMYATFVMGSGAMFAGSIKKADGQDKPGSAKALLCSSSLFFYALVEAAAWKYGANSSLKLLGKTIPMWAIRTGTGVFSGTAGVGGILYAAATN